MAYNNLVAYKKDCNDCNCDGCDGNCNGCGGKCSK